MTTKHRGEPLPPCAFCGRPTALLPDVGAVAHALPTCEKYDALEPAAYLDACESKLEEHLNHIRRIREQARKRATKGESDGN